MKTLRLAPDYFCFPVWHDDGEQTGDFGDIDPKCLPISPELSADLIFWATWFDKGLDINDPANSPGMSDEERMQFNAKGHELLVRLRKELGPSFSVNSRYDCEQN